MSVSRLLSLLFFFGFFLGWTNPAWAISELGARIREGQVLKVSPEEDAAESEVRVDSEEKVFVLGSSVDSQFVQLLRKNGETGWIQVSQVDLFRVDRKEYDEYYYAAARARIFSPRWNLHLGTSLGTLPLGVGVESLVNINLLRKGIFESSIDQLELSTGFRYHLGADPTPILQLDGTLYSKSAKPLLELPIQLAWLFRFGLRGETMFGPRLGFSYVRDSYNRFGSALPAVAGFEFRYFPGDTLGFSWSTTAYLRSVIYYSTSFGLNLRY